MEHTHEYAFEMASSPIRFGFGVTREVGPELKDLGKQHVLADAIIKIMRDLKVPNGLRELGYQSAVIPALVEGALPQHRVTKLSPHPAGPEDLARLFEESMVAW